MFYLKSDVELQGWFHLPEFRLVVVTPGQALWDVLPAEGVLNVFGYHEQIDVGQVLPWQNILFIRSTHPEFTQTKIDYMDIDQLVQYLYSCGLCKCDCGVVVSGPEEVLDQHPVEPGPLPLCTTSHPLTLPFTSLETLRKEILLVNHSPNLRVSKIKHCFKNRQGFPLTFLLQHSGLEFSVPKILNFLLLSPS